MTSSSRLAAYQAKQAGSEYIISRDRAARALADFDSRGGDMKAQAGRVLQEFIDERSGKPWASADAGQASKAVPKAATPTAATYSGVDVQLAQIRGAATERARMSAVFASEHSRGRERACAQLLAHKDNFSAAAITGFLATAPLDKDRAATGSRESSQAAWDKVNAQRVADDPFLAKHGATPATPKPAAGQTTSQARWEKANAKVASTDDVWARAYGEK